MQGRKVHAVKVSAGKWNLGRALCGCTISRWTPTSDKADEVTCPSCRKKLTADVQRKGAANAI